MRENPVNLDHLTADDGFMEVRKKPIIVHAKKIDFAFEVNSPEGCMTGNAGDYLLIGVKGEKYPVEGDIFEETYNVITEAL